jgi:hypothetical protein
MASFVFRRAQPPDYPAILRLESENFIANLSEEEQTQKQDLAGRFDIGVAFVSRSNPHSLQAHVGGVRDDRSGGL